MPGSLLDLCCYLSFQAADMLVYTPPHANLLHRGLPYIPHPIPPLFASPVLALALALPPLTLKDLVDGEPRDGRNYGIT